MLNERYDYETIYYGEHLMNLWQMPLRIASIIISSIAHELPSGEFSL